MYMRARAYESVGENIWEILQLRIVLFVFSRSCKDKFSVVWLKIIRCFGNNKKTRVGG